MLKTLNLRLKVFAESKWFFRTTLILFIAEAAWVAITSNFPMAFDESYHFGLIQFFSHHLNPLVSSQPSSTYNLGDIAHNPSFLYHYLMSFPYRLISFITSDLKTQIISLRFINIAMMVASLVFMKRILRQLSLPNSLNNIILLVFALTPLVTVLAAQMNYDNLLLLLSIIAVYVLLIVSEKVGEGKIDVIRIVSIICICLYASLVQFEFLPIFLGIVIVLTWQLVGLVRKDKQKLIKQIKQSYLAVSIQTKALLLVLLVLGSGLFATFYGYNLVKYHNIVPQCNQVLTTTECEQYYSWDRNYTVTNYDRAHNIKATMNPLRYTEFWFKVEYYQLFGEIFPTGGLIYIARDFYVIIIALSVISTLCAIVTIKQILTRFKLTWLTCVIAITYLSVLWLRNYHDYLNLGQPLAIQGRYLVPVLIYIYVMFGLGITQVLEFKRMPQIILRPLIAFIVIASFVYFGGFARYVSQVSPRYGWPKTAIQSSKVNNDPNLDE
jgi:hypothetical protein